MNLNLELDLYSGVYALNETPELSFLRSVSKDDDGKMGSCIQS